MSDGAAKTIKNAAVTQHTPELTLLLSKLRPFQRSAFDFAVNGILSNDDNSVSWKGMDGTVGGREKCEKANYSEITKSENNGTIAGAGTGRILLGDEMGLGKTISSLAIMSAYQQTEWPLLILCPASLRYTWPAEIEKFCPWISSTSIHVVKGKDDVDFAIKIKKWRERQLSDARKNPLKTAHKQSSTRIEIVIVTYSLLQTRFQVANVLKSCNFQCIIADESHNLKQMSSQRCELALPLLQNSRRLVLLSGTPALNRPVELWPQLTALDPTGKLFGKNGMKYTEFTKRYCNAKVTRFGWDVKGVSNADELHSYLKKIMVRRLKSEVLHDLPSKQRSIVPVTVADKEKDCRDIMSQLSAARQSLAEILNDACDEEVNSARFESRRLLMEAYQLSGISKAPATTEYILDWLEGSGTQKLVVFAHHKEVLDYMETKISAKYKGKLGMMRIDGSVPPSERALRVKKFQSNASMRLALLSMTAAGVGLTLTAASSIIFAELHWVPGVLAQAEDRCHRIGQENSVNVMYCICKDQGISVDMSLWAMLARKVGTLGRVVDGQKGKNMNAIEEESAKAYGVSAEEELASFFASSSTPSTQKKTTHSPPIKGTIQSFFAKQVGKRNTTVSTSLHTAKSPTESTGNTNSIISLLDDSDDETSLVISDEIVNDMSISSSTKWLESPPFSCNVCTYENKSGNLCAMCGTLKMHNHYMPKLELNESQNKSGVDFVNDGQWACNTCTLFNKGNYLSCSACGEVRCKVEEVGTVVFTENQDLGNYSHVSQSPTPNNVRSNDLDLASETKNVMNEKLSSDVGMLSFSVSKNSGRVALYHDDQPLHVNFDISQVLTKECFNQLEDNALSRSISGNKVAVIKQQLQFDHFAIIELFKSIEKFSGNARLDEMSKELKAFVSHFLGLREVEKKAVKDSGLNLSASSLKSVAARLIISSVSGITERYVGGAKENAILNMKINCATKRDVDIINGKACAWCGKSLYIESNGVVDATYCSFTCAEEGRVRRGGMYSSTRIRSQLYTLEHGICCLCKIDAHALYSRILSLAPVERLNVLMNANFRLPKASAALNRLLHDPKESDFWQADHIVAVAEGGGGCGMDNIRTLCTTCHINETAKLHSRLKTSKADDATQMDILSAFSGSINKKRRRIAN